jgi:hypothetical protein
LNKLKEMGISKNTFCITEYGDIVSVYDVVKAILEYERGRKGEGELS